MKMLFCFLLLSMVVKLQAQEHSVNQLKLQVSGVEFSRFRSFGGLHNLGIDEIRHLPTSSSLMGLDLSGHTRTAYWIDNRARGIHGAVNFDLKRSNGATVWGNPTLRVGMSYNRFSSGFSVYNRFNSTLVDSIAYSNQGSTVYFPVDSISYSHHQFGIMGQRLRLNTAFLLRTDQSKRWSFYAGIGLGFGASFGTFLTHESMTGYGYSAQTPHDFPSLQSLLPPGSAIKDFRKYPSRPIYDLSLSFPMGFDFRLGSCDNLWRHVYWFGEVSPVFSLTKYAGAQPLGSFGFSSSTGLRIKFKDL